jgi:MFS family permease
MIQKTTIWRVVGGALAGTIVLCVIINSLLPDTVPSELTMLLFGSLIALGVGYSIVNTKASVARLAPKEETKFRRTQYLVSFVFSVILALAFLLREVRESPAGWLLAPIIVLPGILLYHEWRKMT